MEPRDIRTHRERLGLTQGQCARLVGVDGRTWRRWEGEEASSARTMPEPVVRLLRLMARPDVVGWLDEMENKRVEIMVDMSDGWVRVGGGRRRENERLRARVEDIDQ